jgi:hypothetical protein
MKIEFNGRVVAGFLLGALCGAAALIVAVAGPVGRIQREREEARFTIEAQKGQIQQLQSTVAIQQQQLDAAAQAPPQSQNALNVLNAVHPGLGTLAGVVGNAIQADQARRTAAAIAAQQAFEKANAACGAGARLETGPWQGLKCVAVDIQ